MAGIDLNSDLGESFGAWTLGDDAALLRLVTSANVACGFHAGDPATMLRTCRLAAERGVTVGAHVSYPDLAGFGRRSMDIDPADLYADTIYQIGAVRAVAETVGARLGYVKPHGALYNRIVSDPAQAAAVAHAARQTGLPLLGLPDSAIEAAAAEAGVRFWREGFLDRAYRDDGTLVPRSERGSVLTDPQAAAERSVDLARSGRVESLCVHGDSPSAVAMAEAALGALEGAGIEVRPFA
ncbi:LamB/YcsF family protein [Lysobacter korlensis]|uniref:LamB/YcsF family protein n=1 Tax=Lysobacter korlensis TaxID=553636 RepID=A0ABV6RV37_9GAMM